MEATVAKVRKRRIRDLLPKDVSIGQIARGTDLSRSHVSRIFNGHRVPSLRCSEKISAYIGVSMDTFSAYVREEADA